MWEDQRKNNLCYNIDVAYVAVLKLPGVLQLPNGMHIITEPEITVGYQTFSNQIWQMSRQF